MKKIVTGARPPAGSAGTTALPAATIRPPRRATQ